METQKLVPKEGKAMAGFDAEAYINEPRWAHSSLGLERVRDLLERLGRPQDAVPAVHVAGTNGKGSVCAYLAAMLRAAGCRVGLFTSPGVMGFAERVQVDGQPISPEALHEVTLRVREAAEAVEAERGEHPTEFELMAAVAFEHFRASGCGIAVVEVGLGGRLDATNVIVPEASVIARIGLDHTGVLGTTLAEIAAEKAGIVKPGVPVASWPQEPTAAAVVEARCAELGCELSVPDFAQLRAGAVEAAADGSLRRPFRYRGTPYVTALLGSYQPANAALALEAAAILAGRGWDLPPQARACGIAAARWPGRFEVLAPPPAPGAAFVVDGGHNAQGAQALADSLVDVFGGGDPAALAGKVAFIMGAMEDKDYGAMLDAVAPLARRLVAYAPDNPRALPAEQLASAARAHLAPGTPVEAASTPEDAIARACSGAGAGDVVVAFGSLYGVAAVKRAYGRWAAAPGAGGPSAG